MPNPVAIPISDGTSPELFQRVPTRQPRDPSRKSKRRTPEGNVADHRAWSEGMVRQIRVRFEFDRGRAEGTGITQYRWRSVGDEDVCKVRWSRNVQRFPLRGADDFDHPGFMLCT